MRSDCRLSLSLVGLFTALLLLAAPVQAQDTDGLDLRWGVSAGATSGAFQGDARAFENFFCPGGEACTLEAQPLPKFDGRETGVQFGVSLQTAVTDWLTTRTELNYVQTGGAVRRTARGYRELATYRINYLTLPLLAEMRSPWRIGAVHPALFLGPALGVTLDWRTQSTVGRVPGPSFFSDVSQGPIGIDKVPAAAMAAVGGIELAYDLPSGRTAALEVRYRRGLTSAVVREDAVGRSAARTGAVSVGLRYVFSR